MNKENILFVEDEKNMRVALRAALAPAYEVSLASHGLEALALLRAQEFMAVVTDLVMPGMNGLDLLQEVKRLYPKTAVIIVTAFGAVKSAVEAMRLGAFDYLTKPFEVEEMQIVLEKALRLRRMGMEIEYLRGELSAKYQFESLVGRSQAMSAVHEVIAKTIGSDYPVLITGESGTGKELVARVYHFNGPRCPRSFLAVNCSTLSPELMESELFGHVKGAFSGAIRDKAGLFEVADGGTLFLDEIGEMSPNLQARLLRVLEDGEVRRVGATESSKVNVRLISATNRDLEEEMAHKRFRRDLLYRLNLLSIHLPPLRHRVGDAPLLTFHFLRGIESRVKSVSPEAMQALENYQWPGNVRELENVIKRGCLLATTDTLDLKDLPDPVRMCQDRPRNTIVDPPLQTLDVQMASYVEHVLTKCAWNVSEAARVLGLPRSTLRSRMRVYGIEEHRPVGSE